MKELIGTAIFIASLVGTGNFVAREVHDAIRNEALKKVSQGMPSLTKLTTALRTKKTTQTKKY